jgi:lysophospholipase L1-like esterase
MKPIILCSVLLFFFGFACAQKYQEDSPRTNEKKIKQYDFIRYDLNYIEYADRNIFRRFFERWNDTTGVITFAHFGDSHVQPDYFTSVVRNSLQNQKGNAGRGMIFPYSMAKTYSQMDYTSTFTGTWKTTNSIHLPPKLPTGISGFTSQTDEKEVSFSIFFKTSLPKGEKVLKLFYAKDSCSYRLSVRTKNHLRYVDLDSILDVAKPYISFDFSEIGDTIHFELSKKRQDDKIFQLHGISIENKNARGVLYHNLGVGGANYYALPFQKRFHEQFPHLNADLVIFDWGTNDVIYKNEIAEELVPNVLESIRRVREVSPNTVIMLTSFQDMNRKGKNITAARQFANLMRKIAFENDCLFYDWYEIAGGEKSMNLWAAHKLGAGDHIHLTFEGYQFKGQMFSQAFANTFEHFTQRDSLGKLVLRDTADINLRAPSEQFRVTYEHREIVAPKSPNETKNNKAKSYTGTGTGVVIKSSGTGNGGNSANVHVVGKGENLGAIALRYKTSVANLKRLNNLKNDLIHPGQKLILR